MWSWTPCQCGTFVACLETETSTIWVPGSTIRYYHSIACECFDNTRVTSCLHCWAQDYFILIHSRFRRNFSTLHFFRHLRTNYQHLWHRVPLPFSLKYSLQNLFRENTSYSLQFPKFYFEKAFYRESNFIFHPACIPMQQLQIAYEYREFCSVLLPGIIVFRRQSQTPCSQMCFEAYETDKDLCQLAY